MKKSLEFKYPNKLKEVRERQGLLQREVAALLGFNTEDRICRWEKGYSIPSIPNLIKLIKLFNTSLEELYPEM